MMKTAVLKDTHVAIVHVEDSVFLGFADQGLQRGDPAEIYFSFARPDNTEIVENSGAPDGEFWPGKYLLIDGVWSVNPDFIPPRQPDAA